MVCQKLRYCFWLEVLTQFVFQKPVDLTEKVDSTSYQLGSSTKPTVCSHPLLGIVVVFGGSGSVRGLWAEWDVFLQGGFLVQGGVAHVLVDGVNRHLGDVLRRLTGRNKYEGSDDQRNGR